MSNGYETMLIVSWSALLIAMLSIRKGILLFIGHTPLGIHVIGCSYCNAQPADHTLGTGAYFAATHHPCCRTHDYHPQNGFSDDETAHQGSLALLFVKKERDRFAYP